MDGWNRCIGLAGACREGLFTIRCACHVHDLPHIQPCIVGWRCWYVLCNGKLLLRSGTAARMQYLTASSGAEQNPV